MNLQEIVKQIDNIKASIDTAFETGKLDLDKISSELGAIGDSLAESMKENSGPELRVEAKIDKSSRTARQNLKIEDYTA